jgi:nucleotide-binding universal stress UspA family protein
VVDLSDYPIDPDSPDWERQAQQTLAAEKDAVETALVDLPGSWSYHAAHGDPVALLREVADRYDALMFIVGTRGEGAGSVVSRLLGTRPSVSHGLIARSHRPVLVIPPHAA